MSPAPDQPETSSTEERLVELLAEGQKSNSSVMKILIIGICALAAALIIVVAAVVGADLHISFLGIDAGGGRVAADAESISTDAGPREAPQDEPPPREPEALLPGPRYGDTGGADGGEGAPLMISPEFIWTPPQTDTGS
jgi:hypothetical protein